MNNEMNNEVQESVSTNNQPMNSTPNVNPTPVEPTINKVPSIEPIQTNTVESPVAAFAPNESVTKKKGFNKGYLIVATILIAIVVGIYFFIFNNPKNIFLRAINNEYKKLDKYIEENIDNSIYEKSMTSNMELDFDIKVADGMLSEDEQVLIDELNKLSLNGSLGIDYKNKELLFGVDAEYDAASLFNMMIYGSNESLYLELKNLFDKYIEIPVEEYETIFETNDELLEESEYILEAIKDSVLKNMKKDDFKTSTEKILLGTKTVKTKKVTYTLTQEVANELLTNVLKDLKNDKNFIEALANISETDKDDIKDSLDEMIEDLEDAEDFDDESVIELSVYTTGLLNQAVQYEFVVRDDFDEYSIFYSNYNDVKRANFVENEETIISIVNEKTKKDTYATTIKIDTIKLVINSKKSNNNWKHTYTMTQEDNYIEIRGEVTTKTEEVTKDKEYTSEVSFSLDMGLTDEEDVMTVSVTAKGENKITNELNIPSLSNSVLYTDLTEIDINTIKTNITNNQTFVNLYTKLSELLDSSEEDYGYDSDYDSDYDYEF